MAAPKVAFSPDSFGSFGTEQMADHRHPSVHNLSPVEGEHRTLPVSHYIATAAQRKNTRAPGKRDQRYMGPVTRAGLKEYNKHFGVNGPATGPGQKGYD